MGLWLLNALREKIIIKIWPKTGHLPKLRTFCYEIEVSDRISKSLSLQNLRCPSPLAWKLAHKWSMNWLSKKRKDTSFHIMSQKDQNFERKFTFDIPKLKFQNGLKEKTFNFWAFLRQTGLWEPNPKHFCKYLFRFWILWTTLRFWHLSW